MESQYVENKHVLAINQSNYPLLIEVYDVDSEHITFGSNANRGHVHTNKLYYNANKNDYYFHHYGIRYYIGDCMTV